MWVNNWHRGFWRLADPKISLASFASMFLGASAAAAAGDIEWIWLLHTVIGIFAVEVAKNASGELFDFDSGVDQAVAAEDRSPFSGGKRAIVDGLLTRTETRRIAIIFYLLAIAEGLLIVVCREPRVLLPGIAGMTLAFFYHAPPLRLAYVGLGELAVGIAYGPLIACGTFLVQQGRWDMQLFALSLPLGLLICAFLWINEFPDYRADRACGKRNLVVRLGRRTGARVFAVLVSAAVAVLMLAVLCGVTRWSLAGLVAAIPAAWASLRLLREYAAVPRIVPAQAATLLAFVIYALATGVGLLLS